MNLAVPSIILAVLAGGAQFWQAQMMVKRKPPLVKGKEIKGSSDEKMLSVMNKQMVYFMPFITIIIGISMPAGLTLYWFLTTLLMALQQLWMFKKKPKDVQVTDTSKNVVIEIDKENDDKQEDQSSEKETLEIESGDESQKRED